MTQRRAMPQRSGTGRKAAIESSSSTALLMIRVNASCSTSQSVYGPRTILSDVISTHPDSDHARGLREFLRELLIQPRWSTACGTMQLTLRRRSFRLLRITRSILVKWFSLRQGALVSRTQGYDRGLAQRAGMEPAESCELLRQSRSV